MMLISETLDEAARARRFQALVSPYLAPGRKLARKLTGNGHDADDVLQDASLRAYRFIEGCRGDNPKAWFLAIVRNAAFSWLQKERLGHMLVSLDEDDARLHCETLIDRRTPEIIVLATEATRFRQRMMRMLSAPHREVLALREEEEMSYKEIADRIGIPAGTVMSRLARARAACGRRERSEAALVGMP